MPSGCAPAATAARRREGPDAPSLARIVAERRSDRAASPRGPLPPRSTATAHGRGGPADLEKGPGHYTDTAYPWQEHGRVGIAGHRTTYLHPFFHLDRMRVGDPIGVVLNQTVRPTLVLTTCDPPYSASNRLIVTADRVSCPQSASRRVAGCGPRAVSTLDLARAGGVCFEKKRPRRPALRALPIRR
jgi:hypothetical protein